MSGTLAKLQIILGLDASDVQKGSKDAQQAVGGLSTGAKLAFGAVGVAAAAGFGVAAKGALEAQAAQGKFMAATGATRDEAKQFVSSMDSLAGSAGTVGMKFEDLAALGTTVEQQFGTTGQKTQDLTENIAEFAKVTGQDAAGAAGDLEDTLSAFGLSADDAAGFMDNLKASSQRFGTDAGPEALQVLRDMSPALQDLGGDLDDGIGFLNLFEGAGLDASAAALGLKAAVNKLKPGQSLDDLIAQVGAIEDPFLRAQKATELFGKGGQKLAAAIKPGMTSLEDFKVSAEDARGAVSEAADAILTDGDKIRQFFDKALAGMREIGQQFGPAVTALASLGSLFGPAIGKSLAVGWDLAAKSSVVKAAAQAAGVAMASDLSLGLAGAGGLALIGKVGSDLIGELARAAGGTIDKAFHPWEAAGLNVGNTTGAAVSQGVKASIEAHLPDDAREAMSAVGLAAIFTGYGEEAGTAGGEAAAPAWQAAMADAADRNKNSMAMYQIMVANHEAQTKAAEDIWNDSARAITGDMTGTLKSAKDDISGAMDDLLWAINHPMALEKDILKVQGELNSKTLKDALASSNPEIAAQAQQTQSRLLGIWAELDPKGYAAAQAASNSVQDGLNDNYAGALTDARGFVSRFNEIFASLRQNYHVSVGVAAGIAAKVGRLPTFAGGGDAPAGLRIVGENGPELEVGPPAHIFSNDILQRLLSRTGDVVFNIYDATDPKKVADEVARKLESIERLRLSMSPDTSGRPI